MNDTQRALITRALSLEAERLDLLVEAIRLNVADLMPPSWLNLAESPDLPVPVSFETILTETDGETMTVRDMRKFISWLGAIADAERHRAAA